LKNSRYTEKKAKPSFAKYLERDVAEGGVFCKARPGFDSDRQKRPTTVDKKREKVSKRRLGLAKKGTQKGFGGEKTTVQGGPLQGIAETNIRQDKIWVGNSRVRRQKPKTTGGGDSSNGHRKFFSHVSLLNGRWEQWV